MPIQRPRSSILSRRGIEIGACVVAIASALAFWPSMSATSAVLVGFILGAWVYLVLILRRLARLDHAGLARLVEEHDANHLIVMVSGCAILGTAMVALAVLLTKGAGGPAHVPIAAVAILTAWVLLHVLAAIHYAHLQFIPDRKAHKSLEFPGTTEAVFSDIVYFSFTIGMTFQTSDVAVLARQTRLVVLVHAFASFLFNMFILAVGVSAIGAVI